MKFLLSSLSDFAQGFTVTLVGQVAIGTFSFYIDDDGPAHSVQVVDSLRGRGYGKLLLLKAIQVANDMGPGFQSDIRGITNEQKRVYASLERNALIEPLGLGVYKLTDAGEAFLESAVAS